MRTALVMVAFLLTSLSLSAAEQAAVDGPWLVHSVVYGNETDTTCTFTQKGADLTGTCKPADAPGIDVTGKVDGDKVSWTQKSEYQGTPLTLEFVGTLKDGAIKGTLTVTPFGVDGEFTATRPK